MPNSGNGIVAGFIATNVISVLMAMKQMLGLMPAINSIEILTGLAGASAPIVGWVMHFMIGSLVWGVLFARIEPFLPGGAVSAGIIFSIGAWLVMMLVVMPTVGAGIFGQRIGIAAPVASLLLHMIFGAVLGWTYNAQMLRHPAVVLR